MATETALSGRTSPAGGIARSWIDVGLGLVDRVPYAPWGAAAIVFAVGVGVSLAIEALSGVVPDDTAAGNLAFNMTFPALFIIGLHLVDRVARRSLATVRVALDVDDAGFAALSADLLRTPPLIANIGLAFGSAAAWSAS